MIEILETDQYVEWFEGLRDQKARLRIEVRIRRLSLGNPGDVKPVGGGISELRIDHGPGYRIYFTRRGEQVILLTNGGDKSSQQRDISRAKEIASAYVVEK